jgi:hypothetical protein
MPKISTYRALHAKLNFLAPGLKGIPSHGQVKLKVQPSVKVLMLGAAMPAWAPEQVSGNSSIYRDRSQRAPGQ